MHKLVSLHGSLLGIPYRRDDSKVILCVATDKIAWKLITDRITTELQKLIALFIAEAVIEHVHTEYIEEQYCGFSTSPKQTFQRFVCSIVIIICIRKSGHRIAEKIHATVLRLLRPLVNVHSFIRLMKKLTEITSALLQLDIACSHSRHAAKLILLREALDRAANLCDKVFGFLCLIHLDDCNEFIAAIARDPSHIAIFPHDTLERRADRPECMIALLMTVDIIHGF